MSFTPISKYEYGKLWTLDAGEYVEDLRGWDATFRLMVLKSLPEEYRTQQDRDSIKALETAFKARRAAEDKEET